MIPLHDGNVVAGLLAFVVGQGHFDRGVKSCASRLNGPGWNPEFAYPTRWGHRKFVGGHRADDQSAHAAAVGEGDAVGFDFHLKACNAWDGDDHVFVAAHGFGAAGQQGGQVNGVGQLVGLAGHRVGFKVQAGILGRVGVQAGVEGAPIYKQVDAAWGDVV